MRKSYQSKYWNHKGKHQKLYKKLHEELVPREGKAENGAGEILRIVVNLYYDVHNNGGCNFDNMRGDRTHLLLSVPKYAEQATKRYIRQPHYTKWLDDYEYQKFLDEYVDWAILYVEHLHKGDSLQAHIPED